MAGNKFGIPVNTYWEEFLLQDGFNAQGTLSTQLLAASNPIVENTNVGTVTFNFVDGTSTTISVGGSGSGSGVDGIVVTGTNLAVDANGSPITSTVVPIAQGNIENDILASKGYVDSQVTGGGTLDITVDSGVVRIDRNGTLVGTGITLEQTATDAADSLTSSAGVFKKFDKAGGTVTGDLDVKNGVNDRSLNVGTDVHFTQGLVSYLQGDTSGKKVYYDKDNTSGGVDTSDDNEIMNAGGLEIGAVSVGHSTFTGNDEEAIIELGYDGRVISQLPLNVEITDQDAAETFLKRNTHGEVIFSLSNTVQASDLRPVTSAATAAAIANIVASGDGANQIRAVEDSGNIFLELFRDGTAILNSGTQVAIENDDAGHSALMTLEAESGRLVFNIDGLVDKLAADDVILNTVAGKATIAALTTQTERIDFRVVFLDNAPAPGNAGNPCETWLFDEGNSRLYLNISGSTILINNNYDPTSTANMAAWFHVNTGGTGNFNPGGTNTDGFVLTATGGTGYAWEAPTGGSIRKVADLSSTTLPSPSEGDVVYLTADWTDTSGGGSVKYYEGLFTYSGSLWVGVMNLPTIASGYPAGTYDSSVPFLNDSTMLIEEITNVGIHRVGSVFENVGNWKNLTSDNLKTVIDINVGNNSGDVDFYDTDSEVIMHLDSSGKKMYYGADIDTSSLVAADEIATIGDLTNPTSTPSVVLQNVNIEFDSGNSRNELTFGSEANRNTFLTAAGIAIPASSGVTTSIPTATTFYIDGDIYTLPVSNSYEIDDGDARIIFSNTVLNLNGETSTGQFNYNDGALTATSGFKAGQNVTFRKTGTGDTYIDATGGSGSGSNVSINTAGNEITINSTTTDIPVITSGSVQNTSELHLVRNGSASDIVVTGLPTGVRVREYAVSTAYIVGDLTYHAGQLFECTTAYTSPNSQALPQNQPNNWKVVTDNLQIHDSLVSLTNLNSSSALSATIAIGELALVWQDTNASLNGIYEILTTDIANQSAGTTVRKLADSISNTQFNTEVSDRKVGDLSLQTEIDDLTDDLTRHDVPSEFYYQLEGLPAAYTTTGGTEAARTIAFSNDIDVVTELFQGETLGFSPYDTKRITIPSGDGSTTQDISVAYGKGGTFAIITESGFATHTLNNVFNIFSASGTHTNAGVVTFAGNYLFFGIENGIIIQVELGHFFNNDGSLKPSSTLSTSQFFQRAIPNPTGITLQGVEVVYWGGSNDAICLLAAGTGRAVRIRQMVDDEFFSLDPLSTEIFTELTFNRFGGDVHSHQFDVQRIKILKPSTVNATIPTRSTDPNTVVTDSVVAFMGQSTLSDSAGTPVPGIALAISPEDNGYDGRVYVVGGNDPSEDYKDYNFTTDDERLDATVHDAAYIQNGSGQNYFVFVGSENNTDPHRNAFMVWGENPFNLNLVSRDVRQAIGPELYSASAGRNFANTAPAVWFAGGNGAVWTIPLPTNEASVTTGWGDAANWNGSNLIQALTDPTDPSSDKINDFLMVGFDWYNATYAAGAGYDGRVYRYSTQSDITFSFSLPGAATEYVATFDNFTSTTGTTALRNYFAASANYTPTPPGTVTFTTNNPDSVRLPANRSYLNISQTGMQVPPVFEISNTGLLTTTDTTFPSVHSPWVIFTDEATSVTITATETDGTVHTWTVDLSTDQQHQSAESAAEQIANYIGTNPSANIYVTRPVSNFHDAITVTKPVIVINWKGVHSFDARPTVVVGDDPGIDEEGSLVIDDFLHGALDSIGQEAGLIDPNQYYTKDQIAAKFDYVLEQLGSQSGEGHLVVPFTTPQTGTPLTALDIDGEVYTIDSSGADIEAFEKTTELSAGLTRITSGTNVTFTEPVANQITISATDTDTKVAAFEKSTQLSTAITRITSGTNVTFTETTDDEIIINATLSGTGTFSPIGTNTDGFVLTAQGGTSYGWEAPSAGTVTSVTPGTGLNIEAGSSTVDPTIGMSPIGLPAFQINTPFANASITVNDRGQVTNIARGVVSTGTARAYATIADRNADQTTSNGFVAIITGAGGTVYIYTGPKVAGAPASVSTDDDWTLVSDPATALTQANGDLLYARLAAGNTYSGSNTFNNNVVMNANTTLENINNIEFDLTAYTSLIVGVGPDEVVTTATGYDTSGLSYAHNGVTYYRLFASDGLTEILTTSLNSPTTANTVYTKTY